MVCNRAVSHGATGAVAVTVRLVAAALAASCLVTSAAAQVTDLPSLDALVTYESRSVTHAGVTEMRRFSNRLIRRPGHVWLERDLPVAPAGKISHVGHDGKGAVVAGHRHFDFELASQHLTRSADGTLRADYVDRIGRQVVFVPPTEYSVPGFDGSWDNAAALVSEKTVAAMPLAPLPSAVAGAVWHAEARNGWFNRVLWSTRSKIALVVESGRSDGSVFRRTVVDLQPLTPAASLPWKQLAGYAQKDYDDFMD